MMIPHVYHDWIVWIGTKTSLSDTLLHFHAGMAIMIAARIIIRRSLGSFVPFGFVVAGELANETMDWLAYGAFQNDVISDVLHTVLWPFVISLCIRLRPSNAGDSPDDAIADATTVEKGPYLA